MLAFMRPMNKLPAYLASLSLLASAPLSQALPIFSFDHADIGIGLEDGELELHFHSEELELELEPDEVVLRLLPSAEIPVPAGGSFSFLGAPGTPVYVLPEDATTASNNHLLFLGLGTEEIDPADLAGDITLTLTNLVFTPEPGASGTASFATYNLDAFGVPTVVMDSGDGITAADSMDLTAGTHSHVNWAFTKPGKYLVSFSASAPLTGGGTATDSATFTFIVKSAASGTGLHLAKGNYLEIDDQAVQVTTLGAVSAGGTGGGLFTAAFKGVGTGAASITTANNMALFLATDFRTEVVARKGDAATGLSGLTLAGFSHAHVEENMACAYVATVAGAGVTRANDAVLYASPVVAGSFAPELVAREGSAVPGLSGHIWHGFSAVSVGANGAVIVQATAKNTGTGRNVAIIARKTLSEPLSLVVFPGQSLTTDSGTHTVRSFMRPTSAGQRVSTENGTIEVLVSFTDGSVEILRL
jgi:surface-anchored protein